jgi:surface antigen
MSTGGRVAATACVMTQCIQTGGRVAIAGCVKIEGMITDGRIGGAIRKAEERVLSLSGIETRNNPRSAAGLPRALAAKTRVR